MRTIYCDGHFLKVNDQVIEAFTPGAFRSKGVFETMLASGEEVMDTALHLRRLRMGLKALSIKPPLIRRAILSELLKSNKLSCARVRLMVWQSGKQVHVLAVAVSYKIPNKQNYRVCVIKTDRAANDLLANVKSLDYGMFAGAYFQAQSQGFDEALLLNRRGYIFEASRANIFWAKDKVLYTPPLSSGCLNGITRQQVIKQAKNLRVPVKEKNLTLETLKEADAAFLSNSLIGIKPIEITEIKIA